MSHPRIRQTKEGIWVVDGDTHLTKWVEETGRLDHDRTIDRLLEFIPENGVVVDAGAAIGDHTIAYARKVGVKGWVFAFEPNLMEFACLTMNCSEHPQVVHFNAGLDKEFNIWKYHIDQQCMGSSRVCMGGESQVCLVPLDKAIGNLIVLEGRFDFLKVDVEGMELLVLHGGRELIREFRPVIYCEVNRGRLAEWNCSPEKLMAYLRSKGYKLENFDYTQPNNFDFEQFDMICKPE